MCIASVDSYTYVDSAYMLYMYVMQLPRAQSIIVQISDNNHYNDVTAYPLAHTCTCTQTGVNYST